MKPATFVLMAARGGDVRRPVCSSHAAGALAVDHSLILTPKVAA